MAKYCILILFTNQNYQKFKIRIIIEKMLNTLCTFSLCTKVADEGVL